MIIPDPRREILEMLKYHKPWNDHEAAMLRRMIEFVEAHSDCLSRELLMGHLTASAWVTDPTGSKVVLIHHRKLNKWLQPGGHADGDPDLLAVARKEVEEETGLQALHAAGEGVFDIDIHFIPERKGVPGHEHFDVRFHFFADPDLPFIANHETNAIEWVDLEKVKLLNGEESVVRMVERTLG